MVVYIEAPQLKIPYDCSDNRSSKFGKKEVCYNSITIRTKGYSCGSWGFVLPVNPENVFLLLVDKCYVLWILKVRAFYRI